MGTAASSLASSRCAKADVLAVDGNEIFGPDDVQHQLQFLRAAMSETCTAAGCHRDNAPLPRAGRDGQACGDGFLVAGMTRALSTTSSPGQP